MARIVKFCPMIITPFFADNDFMLQMTKAKYFKYLTQVEPIFIDLEVKN